MPETNLTPLELPPGIYLAASRASSRGRYVGGDKIRFYGGKPQKIGGWIRYISTAFSGIARGLFAWVSSTFVNYLALGTATKAYAIVDSYHDLTPYRITGTEANNPFTTTNGSAVVSVHHVGHGVEVGAHVHWTGSTLINNVTLVGEYTVVTVTDVDNFTVTALTTASGSGAGGGAAAAYSYEINPGLASSAAGLGWGTGPYGAGTWGSARSTGITQDLRTWSFDGYGDLLMGSPSGGTIYYWDESASADRFVALSGAPAACRSMFVANERMIVALGTDTPMTMAWCDRDDPTQWTPALNNTANVRTLQEGNKLIAGTRFNDVNFFWSDTSAFLMQFLSSSDEIYSTPPVGKNCGLAGETAFEVLPTMLMWFAARLDLFVYSGGLVDRAPNWDDIRPYIVSRLNVTYLDKMTMGQVPGQNEVHVHYVSVDSADGEPDEWFSVNILDWTYVPHTGFNSRGRTAHVHFDQPGGAIVEAGTDMYLYQHETGVDGVDDSGITIAMPAHVETGPNALYKDRDILLNGYVPDFEDITGNVTLNIQITQWPMSPAPIDEQSFTLTPTTEYQSINMGGRYARLKLSVSDIGADFRLGVPLIDTGIAGATRR